MMSTVTALVTEMPAAARAGAELKAARERLGLSLHDVAAKLRIRLAYLEALEEGCISLLPGNAYALAFVRTYATVLGLDAEAMVRRFRDEAATLIRRTELVFPVPMAERGWPAGALLMLGLVLAVCTYAGWYRLSGDGRLPAETATAIPERLASLAEQALPFAPAPSATAISALGLTTSLPAPSKSGFAMSGLATSGFATSGFSMGEPAASGVSEPVSSLPGAMADVSGMPQLVLTDPPQMQASPAPPVVAISPTSAAAAQLSDQATPAGLSPGPASVATGSAAQSGGQLSSQDAGRIVLRASTDAWVMVKDRSGATLLSRTMKAGESWSVPPRPDLLLTTGNAGGTDILVDGVPTPALGGSGSVRRDLPLDPDLIKDGKLAGAVAPQLAATRLHQ